MYKVSLTKLKEKVDCISKGTQTFFKQQLPDYIYSLPDIKPDLLRWTLNVLYIGVGLIYNWAVSVVLQKIPNMTHFPSNVASMIVLFFLLMCFHTVFPKTTDKFVMSVDTYSSFVLRSMNIMFVPDVIQIVNNPPTTGPEVGRMICVFLVGYFIGFMFCTFLVRFLRFLIFSPCQLCKQYKSNKEVDGSIHMRKTPTIDEESVKENIGSSMSPQLSRVSYVDPSIPSPNKTSDVDTPTHSTLGTGLDLPSGSDCSRSRRDHFLPSAAFQVNQKKYGPLHAFAIWCMEQSSFDDLAFFLIWAMCAFIYIPLPETNPAMPFFRLFLYFSMTLLFYSVACRLPARMRNILHPTIVTSACVLAGIAYFERVKGLDVKSGVNLYKAGITFIGLVEKTNVGWPGAGDLFGAAMDVSIISLAFNVYKARPASMRDWIIIFASIVPMAFLIMFVTPMFAHAIGTSAEDSLVWSSRSVTTAIGIVIAQVLGSNQSVVTCIIVFTGIMGPIFGPSLFKLARVSNDDFMTRGITMGSSSHGVGTAYLITRDKKASGIASLTFAIFGTIGVIVASIPALSDTILRISGF